MIDEKKLQTRVNAIARNPRYRSLIGACRERRATPGVDDKLKFALLGASLGNLRAPFSANNADHFNALLRVCGRVTERLLSEVK